MTEPTLEPLEKVCRKIGGLIGNAVDDHNRWYTDSPRVGFMLLMFTFDEGGWMTYLSNCERNSMIEAMKEFIAKHEEAQDAEHENE